MPKDELDFSELERDLEATVLPSQRDGLHLLPVSHDQFHAQWSLDEDHVERGKMASASSPKETQLVLRAFILSGDAASDGLSNSWTDFSVSGVEGNGYFTVAGSIPQVSASLGLVNRSGRFTPLASGNAIHLPASPTATTIEVEPVNEEVAPVTEEEIVDKAESEAAIEQLDPAPTPAESGNLEKARPPQTEVLPEEEITARLSALMGLPESLAKAPEDTPSAHQGKDATKTIFDAPTQSQAAWLSQDTSIDYLDEKAVLENVRRNLAEDPEPTIAPSLEAVVAPETQEGEGNEEASVSQEAPIENSGGASKSLASQWEELWSDNAPVAISAVFVLTGRIQQGMHLLLGHEVIEPNPSGKFVWKRTLNDFNQAWSLIEATLHKPTVPASPSLEFFSEHSEKNRLLDMQAALEISGRVTDPNYIEKLPEQLEVATDGTFKASCFIPYGAVILPGLSLMGE